MDDIVYEFSSDESSSSQEEDPPAKRSRRRAQPGRRILSGRLYDSKLGVNCHFCRQKTIEDHALCSRCTIAFCGRCLRTRHGENIAVEKDANWVCPKCRGGCGAGCSNCCACGPCRRLQNLAPPRIKVNALEAARFTNVHDYLIHLKTGECQEDISARKAGKGWCRYEEPVRKKEPQVVVKAQVKKEETKCFGEENRPCDGDDGGVHETHKNVVCSSAERVCTSPRISTRAPQAAQFHSKTDESMHEMSDRNVGRGPCTYAQMAKIKKEDTEWFDEEDGLCDVDDVGIHGKGGNVEMAEIKIEETGSFGEEGTLCDDDDVGDHGKRSSSKRVNVAEKLPSSTVPSFLCTGEKFKKSLEAKLQEPFDSNELHKMWEEFNCRKPVLKFRETRQRMSFFATKREGYSYLDHHPELANLIESTKQQEDKLKLLRGFFFWLEHAGSVGAFKPWLVHLQQKKTTENYEDCECIEIDGLDCQVIGMVCPVDEEKKENISAPDGESQVDIKPKIQKEWILPSSFKPHNRIKEEPVD